MSESLILLICKRLLRILGIYLAVIALAGFLFAGFFPWAYKQFDHEPSTVVYSPDKRFKIEYYAIPFLPFRPHYFIGMGCTDCPGYVRLVDSGNDEILQEKYFHMGHDISSGVTWENDRVYMKLFADWPLPKASNH